MDEVTKAKNQFRMEQWTNLIHECQSSGLSVRSWCKQNDVKEQSYYYYLKRIRLATCKQFPTIQSEKVEPVKFAKLQVNTQKTYPSSITIKLPYATVEILDGTSQQTVEHVLLALKNIC